MLDRTGIAKSGGLSDHGGTFFEDNSVLDRTGIAKSGDLSDHESTFLGNIACLIG